MGERERERKRGREGNKIRECVCVGEQLPCKNVHRYAEPARVYLFKKEREREREKERGRKTEENRKCICLCA